MSSFLSPLPPPPKYKILPELCVAPLGFMHLRPREGSPSKRAARQALLGRTLQLGYLSLFHDPTLVTSTFEPGVMSDFPPVTVGPSPSFTLTWETEDSRSMNLQALLHTGILKQWVRLLLQDPTAPKASFNDQPWDAVLENMYEQPHGERAYLPADAYGGKVGLRVLEDGDTPARDFLLHGVYPRDINAAGSGSFGFYRAQELLREERRH